MTRRTRHWPDLLIRWTLVLGLVLASVLPSGTMASRGADGSLIIELCSPDGISRVAISPDGTATPLPEGPDQPQSMPDCPWAAAHLPGADTPALGWALVQPDQMSAFRPEMATTVVVLAPVQPAFQSRAPPAPVI